MFLFRPIQWAVSAFVTLLALYAFFFVPVGGTRTPYEHVRRILGTREAQEFEQDVARAGARVAGKVRQEIGQAVDRAARDLADGGRVVPSPVQATPVQDAGLATDAAHAVTARPASPTPSRQHPRHVRPPPR